MNSQTRPRQVVYGCPVLLAALAALWVLLAKTTSSQAEALATPGGSAPGIATVSEPAGVAPRASWHLPQVAWRAGSGLSRAPLVLLDEKGDSFLLAPVLEAKNPSVKGSLLYYGLFSNTATTGEGGEQVELESLPAKSSAPLWRFPAPLWNVPALADVTGDGVPEIFIATLDGSMACLSSGRPLWELEGFGPFYSSPAVADLDADGKLELVVGSRDHCLYCVDAATGGLKWRFVAGGEVDSSPAVGDLMGDGKLEVVFGSDDGFVYCLDGQGGDLLWKFRANWWVTAPASIVDLEGDGTSEVLVGDDTGTFYCLKGTDGEVLWSFPTPHPVVAEATSCDINNDGRKEVFFCSDAVYCLDARGSPVWRFAPGEPFSTTPVLLSWEGVPWVIVPGDNLYCLDAVSGGLVWQRSLSSRGLFDASASVDRRRNLLLSLCTGSGELVVLRMTGNPGVSSLVWPKPRGNLLNTGNVITATSREARPARPSG